MASSRCARCGREEFLPFRCRLCAQPYCLDHRLPENHGCAGLADYRTRARDERVAAGRREDVAVKVRRPAPGLGALRRVSRFARRSATHLFLTAIVVTFALQLLAGLAIALAIPGIDPFFGGALAECALALGPCGPFQGAFWALPQKPWSVVTNLFAHHGVFHLLFNALFLYFFGLELESRIGRRVLTGLFFAAGAVAAAGQVLIFPGAVLGASGAIMGLLGTLTILAPTMRVMFWFFPMPLWVMTLIFVLFDLGGLVQQGAGIANLAHLLGLALGVGYGLHLKRRGVLPKVASTWASQRRY